MYSVFIFGSSIAQSCQNLSKLIRIYWKVSNLPNLVGPTPWWFKFFQVYSNLPLYPEPYVWNSTKGGSKNIVTKVLSCYLKNVKKNGGFVQRGSPYYSLLSPWLLLIIGHLARSAFLICLNVSCVKKEILIDDELGILTASAFNLPNCGSIRSYSFRACLTLIDWWRNYFQCKKVIKTHAIIEISIYWDNFFLKNWMFSE